MNSTFDTSMMSASESNVEFGNSTRIMNLLVALLFPAFALAADTNEMQMLKTNH
jgi:hypothetical protein